MDRVNRTLHCFVPRPLPINFKLVCIHACRQGHTDLPFSVLPFHRQSFGVWDKFTT